MKTGESDSGTGPYVYHAFPDGPCIAPSQLLISSAALETSASEARRDKVFQFSPNENVLASARQSLRPPESICLIACDDQTVDATGVTKRRYVVVGRSPNWAALDSGSDAVHER